METNLKGVHNTIFSMIFDFFENFIGTHGTMRTIRMHFSRLSICKLQVIIEYPISPFCYKHFPNIFRSDQNRNTIRFLSKFFFKSAIRTWPFLLLFIPKKNDAINPIFASIRSNEAKSLGHAVIRYSRAARFFPHFKNANWFFFFRYLQYSNIAFVRFGSIFLRRDVKMYFSTGASVFSRSDQARPSAPENM